MISKKVFCILLQRIKEANDKLDELSIKLYDIFGSGAVDTIYDAASVDCAIETLAIAVDDIYNLIDYLVYDCDWDFNKFSITYKNTDYVISSFEDLYDLIKEWGRL